MQHDNLECNREKDFARKFELNCHAKPQHSGSQGYFECDDTRPTFLEKYTQLLHLVAVKMLLSRDKGKIAKLTVASLCYAYDTLPRARR